MKFIWVIERSKPSAKPDWVGELFAVLRLAIGLYALQIIYHLAVVTSG